MLITSTKAIEYLSYKDPIFNPKGIETNFTLNSELPIKLGVIDGCVTKEEGLNIIECKTIDGEDLSSNTYEKFMYEVLLHVPRSINILLKKGGDKRVLEAFEDAVEVTVQFLEQELEDINMTGLIITTNHSKSRRENDTIHLHSHMFISDQVYNQNTKSFELLKIKKYHIDQLQFIFSTQLKNNIAHLGYTIDTVNSTKWNIQGYIV